MRAAGIQVDVRDDISPEDLMQAIAPYDAIVVRSRTRVPAALLDVASNLKLVIRGGVGLDSIDLERAASLGVTVSNTPAASSASVAELTVGFLFALARRIPQTTASMRAGEWQKKEFSKGSEIAGKTLGLIGCGRIGQEVAKRAQALGMDVVFSRRTPTDLPWARQVELPELLAVSDYVSLHVPYSPETHHIIGGPEIAAMKDGVYIINCGRGGTLDEEALYEALVSGKVAGAALDVFADEKEDRGRRLFTHPHVIGSPHIGAGTAEAKARVGEEVAAIAVRFHQANP